MLRLRQASSGDLGSIKAILFSALLDSHDALFAYNFPHREQYPQDNEYFFSRLRIDPMLYERHGTVMLAEILRTDANGAGAGAGAGAEKWVPVGLAEWEWRPGPGSIPPVSCLADSWPKALGRMYFLAIVAFSLPYVIVSGADMIPGIYLSVRNYIITSLYTRRDVDVAHYDAFFATNELIQSEYWRPRYPQALQLHALYTRSDAWGKGVGTALVEWGFEIARKSRVPVLVETSSAKRFYEKLGFSPVCSTKIQVEGEDNFVAMDAFVWTGWDDSI